ncbi:helix-turn-helix domain-containing protein [Sphingomonas sp. MMS24-JH45]
MRRWRASGFRQRLANARPIDPRISLITEWADGTRHDIEELRAALNVSHRHLDRLSTAACGLPPRLLANKHKIMRLAAALANGVDTRRDVWTDHYADQPHFNRNFKRFIGVNPTEFLTVNDLLVRNVMQARYRIALSTRWDSAEEPRLLWHGGELATQAPQGGLCRSHGMQALYRAHEAPLRRMVRAVGTRGCGSAEMLARLVSNAGATSASGRLAPNRRAIAGAMARMSMTPGRDPWRCPVPPRSASSASPGRSAHSRASRDRRRSG